MRYSIRKNWVASLDMIMHNPTLLLPFIFIAFFETLALELIYFSTRSPISIVTTPIIKKFFGETFLHYPTHLILVPNIFYYAQVAIYIIAGVLLTSMAVNIYKNINEKLPVKANVLMRNGVKRYGEFMLYGILIMVLMAVLQPLDKIIFSKAFHLVQKIAPGISAQSGRASFTIFMFLTNFLLQAIFIASLPFMVLEKKPLIKAILSSMGLFFKNMPVIIGLTILPFLVYLPIVVLKGATGGLIDATFPEIVLIVTLGGSIASIFVDLFMIICVCRFITDRSKAEGKA